MYGKHFQQSMDQPGMAVNPARGQLNREYIYIYIYMYVYSLSPFAPENFFSRDRFGRPVPRQPAHCAHAGCIWCYHGSAVMLRFVLLYLIADCSTCDSAHRVRRHDVDGTGQDGTDSSAIIADTRDNSPVILFSKMSTDEERIITKKSKLATIISCRQPTQPSFTTIFCFYFAVEAHA